MTSHTGTIIDPLQRRIYTGTLHCNNGKIEAIKEHPLPDGTEPSYIMPGFVDAHVHIESSMLPPSEFGRLAVVHGTVATVSDPHEIANVLGMEGIEFMLRDAQNTPLRIAFGAPSCVPATVFETAGATINAADIRTLFSNPDIRYLSEMMNYPGVLHGDADVLEKIAIARECNRPVDGHAPGLHGEEAQRYCAAGISTDHECTSLDEALDKLACGMSILIREGSAARNFDALHPLISSYPQSVMLCSDDKHPDSLVVSHINALVERALELGHDLMDVLQAASVNPVRHYSLATGLLQPGDNADFIITNSLTSFRSGGNILATYIGGECVARNGVSLQQKADIIPVNKFDCPPRSPQDFRIPAQGTQIRVIEVIDKQLITNGLTVAAAIHNGDYVTDVGRDILKIAVVNRYADAPVAVGFITAFGLKRGAIASSVAHDSHNIVAVGTNDNDLCNAVNAIIHHKGGVSISNGNNTRIVPLDIAGLMSSMDGYTVAARYAELDTKARALGSRLTSPFMSLSFMALLVIPALKMSDKGLFDCTSFGFTTLAAP